MNDDDIIECEHPGCDQEVLDEVAGRVTDTLYIYWVCQAHTEWAEDQIDRKRQGVSL